MDMTGERRIEASAETIWTALNDPEVLKACIPGCESIEKLSDTELKAVVAVKLGPISARFTGKVELSDLDPPNGYTISGEGQGGVAGFAKGGAKVSLLAEAGATTLSYAVNAQIGGKMAQLGARLIDSTAKSYAEQFFTKFAAIVAPPPPVVEAVAGAPAYNLAHEDHDHDPSNPHYFGLPLGVIIAAVVATIAVGITLVKFIF
ncbi:MAG: carbon monoxide dehydrogenase subunit G [Acidocella sp.]|nr:carbon monoxide dehydrogenase subunit G [Acidocella sp.]